MTHQAEFDLTLNLPCSAGVLAYDIETRVTVDYEVEGGQVGWNLSEVRLDGQPGVIREGDKLFWLFEEAITFTKGAECVVIRECFDHWQDARQPDPDAARDRRIERELEGEAA